MQPLKFIKPDEFSPGPSVRDKIVMGALMGAGGGGGAGLFTRLMGGMQNQGQQGGFLQGFMRPNDQTMFNMGYDMQDSGQWGGQGGGLFGMLQRRNQIAPISYNPQRRDPNVNAPRSPFGFMKGLF